jgi:hypothetical protein
MSDEEIVNEGIRIVETGKQQNVPLRLMGAAAFRIHCPAFSEVHKSMDRHLTDLDLITRRELGDRALDVLRQCGYGMDRGAELLMRISQRYQMKNAAKNIVADVFYDKLEMCHTIEIRDRLEVDYPTISLADLMLEKMQIVNINEKDIKDSIILLREHDVSDSDKETVNCVYISNLLSKDWGFYYTVTMNLNKIKTLLPRYNVLSDEDKSIVNQRVEKLIAKIEEAPKSMKWKLRARRGTSQKWYREVEEMPEL